MARPLRVYLDDKDLERLEGWARERGWTKSQAIGVAVREVTRKPVEDPLLGLSGDIDGLPPDLSANLQRHLDETFVAESPAPCRIGRRAAKPVRRLQRPPPHELGLQAYTRKDVARGR